MQSVSRTPRILRNCSTLISIHLDFICAPIARNPWIRNSALRTPARWLRSTHVENENRRDVSTKVEDEPNKEKMWYAELPFQLPFCIVWLPRELNHGRVIRRYRMAQLRARCQNTR